MTEFLIHALFLICVLIFWIVFGCIVLATIDTKEQLFNWAKDAPFAFGFIVIVISWPGFLILYFVKRFNRNEKSNTSS